MTVKVEEEKPKAKSKKQVKEENEKLEKELGKGEETMTVMLVENQDRAINFGVLGIGQAGGRMAAEFYKRGYPVAVVNSAPQDLVFCDVPESQKLLLDIALGGTGKDLALGEDAIIQYQEQISTLMEESFEDCEVIMVCSSTGGGTGAGGVENVCKLAFNLGKPVVCSVALPMSTEDAKAKQNTIETLAKLSDLARDDVISSFFIYDNARIEAIYPGLSMSKFWSVCNEAIVNPFDLFNKLSSNPSKHFSLDPMDFSKIVLNGGCAVAGFIEVEDYEDEDAVAESILNSLSHNILSGGFDLTQTQSVGVIITGSEKSLDIPASNIEYGLSMLSKLTSDGTNIFRGIYEVEDHPDTLRVYTMFSGLGLPQERVDELKEEAKRHEEASAEKEKTRNTNMKIDLGKTKQTNNVDQLHRRIKQKKSAIGKLTKNSKGIIDRRKR